MLALEEQITNFISQLSFEKEVISANMENMPNSENSIQIEDISCKYWTNIKTF